MLVHSPWGTAGSRDDGARRWARTRAAARFVANVGANVGAVGAKVAMRSGALWRLAVLSSLAVLTSGQLCMVTTCVPRLQHAHAGVQHAGVQHACCRAMPETPGPAKSQRSAGTMPCDVVLHAASAPVLAGALPVAAAGALWAAVAPPLVPPARARAPRLEADTGPPLDRLSPAPAGVRAPPQA